MDKSEITRGADWEHALCNSDVFSDSDFCTSPGALDRTSASNIWEQNADAAMKSDNCKKKGDSAGETIKH